MTSYTLTMNTIGNGVIKNGTIDFDPDYLDGTPVTLTATADPNYRLESWTGDYIGGANPVVITMDANKVITGTFSIHATDKIQGEKLYATEWNSAARDLNYLNHRVRKSATEPTLDLVEGDLWLDTTSNKLKRWDGSSWDNSALMNLEDMIGDIDDITDNTFAVPGTINFSLVARKSESSSGFHCWVEVTITKVTNAGGYLVGYKESTATDYSTFSVDQPPSGDPITVTPYLRGGILYDFRFCILSKLGQATPWSSIKQITTLTDSVAPSGPTGLTATAIVDGVLLEWSTCTAEDFAFYNIYAQNTNPPTTKIGESSRPIYMWHKEAADGYVPFWFKVQSVDTAGNTSSMSNIVSTTPLNPEVGDIDDPALPAAAFSVSAQEIDSTTVFRTWFQITITLVAGSGGYTLSYKKNGDTYWIDMFVPEPTSGATVIVTTPDLEANTSYNIRVCTLTKLGQSSSWSSTTTISTSTNGIAPGIPTWTGSPTTPVVNGVILNWNAVTATDLSYYEIYAGILTNPTTLVGSSSQPTFFWKMKPQDVYGVWYFRLKAVDTAGNKSDYSTNQSTTPTKIVNVDIAPNAVEAANILDGVIGSAKLLKGVQPYNSNILFTSTTYNSISYSTGTITFADATTQAITGNSFSSLSAGVNYVYFTVGSTALSVTQTYSSTISDTKGLLAILQVSADTTQEVGIFPIYSKGLNINTDLLAANSVIAENIKAGVVSVDKLVSSLIQITNLTFTDNYLSADRVHWTACTVYYQGASHSISAGESDVGDTYIIWDHANPTVFTHPTSKPAWGEEIFIIACVDHPTGLHRTIWNATYIHGGTLITGTVTAQEVKAGTLTADRLQISTLTDNIILNPSFEQDGCWALVEGTGSATYSSADKTEGSRSLLLPAPTVAYGCRALPLVPGDKYTIRIKVKGTTGTAVGLYIRMNEKTSYPTDDYVTNANRTSTTDFVSNGAIPSIWTTYEYTYTVPAGIYWGSFSIYNWTSGPTGIYIDETEVRKQLTGIHIENGSISSDKIINISAPQVIFTDGTLNDWTDVTESGYTSIKGGRIKTASIDTIQLKAKSVSSDKLTVGVAGSNLVPDGDCESGDRTKEWDAGTFTTSSPYAGTYCLSVGAGVTSVTLSYISVLPSTNYLLKAWLKATSGGTASLNLYWYDKDKVYIGTASTTSTVTSWTLKTVTQALPATAYYVRVGCNSVTQTCFYDDFFLRRQIFTGDIDQYAIVADSIAAYAVETNKIKAGAVTTSKLNVTSIFLDGITWTNNTPTNSISWSSGTVYYNGDEHSITGGTCDVGDKYIYWNHASPNIFQHTISTAQPSYGDEIFMVAINVSGSRRLVWNATMIHGGTLITGSITAQEIEADTITADKLKTGTITGAQQNRLLPNDDLFKIVSTGASYSSPSVRGIYDGREGTTIAQATSSYMVSIYDRTTKAWVSHTSYDVFASTDNATAMANDLNALDNTKIVVIHTFDEPQKNRDFGTLPDAMYKCGASRSIYGAGNTFFRAKSAYILAGIPGIGEGNGIELYSGASDSDVNAYCETTIAIQNGNILDLKKSLLNLTADKVVISGTTYLTSWIHGVTKINGGLIDTGTVTADAIAAKAITTDKLSVGLGNLLADGDFELGDATKEWVGGTASSSSPHGGTYCLSIASGAAAYSKTATAIQPNNKFYGSIWAKKLTGGTAYFSIFWYDINGTYISGSSIGNSSSLTWAEIAGQVTAPANAYYMRAYIYTAGNTCYFDDCFIRKQILSGDMTQYSVLADSIGAGEVKAGKIDALAVSTGNLAAGAVTADKLTINQIILKGITFSVRKDFDAGTWLLDWTTGSIIYNGTSYTITAANNQGAYYLYWDPPNLTLTFTVGKPAYTPTRCLILTFDPATGIINYIWNATIIDGKSIITGTITADEIKAGTITATQIKALTITGSLIAAQTLKTDKIAFNLWSGNDPSYFPGELWYRSDYDEIRFSKGTTLADVSIIPKYPLSQDTAPPENLISNQSFELDRDRDGIPDYWTTQLNSGTPSFYLTTTLQYKGGQSAAISLSAAGEGKFLSSFIPVTPGRKYFLRVAYWGSAGKIHEFTVAHLIQYNKSKVQQSENDPTTADWKTTIPANTWKTSEFDFTIPTGIYYVKVALRNYGSASTWEGICYDDIVFSEQKAAAPSGAVCALSIRGDFAVVSVPTATWTTINTYTVDPFDHDEFFCWASVTIAATSPVPFGLWGRLYDVTDNQYYPVPDVNSLQEGCSMASNSISPAFFFFTIPRNVRGHTLRFQIRHGIGVTYNFAGGFTFWGHSPHYHR